MFLEMYPFLLGHHIRLPVSIGAVVCGVLGASLHGFSSFASRFIWALSVSLGHADLQLVSLVLRSLVCCSHLSCLFSALYISPHLLTVAFVSSVV